MKSVKIALVALTVIAALVYAAKTPVVFCDGLEGFAKPEVTPEVSTLPTGETYVNFGDQLGEKGTLQFTKVDAANVIVAVGNVKSIAQKGKVIGALAGIGALNDTDLQLKLKGITIGTVVAGGVKSAQVDNIVTLMDAGSFAKGTTVKATSSVGGTLMGCFKSVACGWFNDTDATAATTPKSLNLKAKADMGGKVLVSPSLVYKAKNVTVVPAN